MTGVFRDYYAGKLATRTWKIGCFKTWDEGRFRAICQHALEGLASKKLNLDMLVRRRAMAQRRRVVPETIARFIADSAQKAALPLRSIAGQPHTFTPGGTRPR